MSRILIVEDDRIKLHTVLDIIKPEYEYDVAVCETDAMQLAMQNEYEVLITDMQFPKEKEGLICRNAGPELIKKLKELYKEKMPKVIVYSLIPITNVWERLGETPPDEYVGQVVFGRELETMLKRIKEEA